MTSTFQTVMCAATTARCWKPMHANSAEERANTSLTAEAEGCSVRWCQKMKITVDTARWTADASGAWLCLPTRQARSICDGMEQGKSYDVEIKPHRERRSLDANAYLWVLLDKLADSLTVSKQRPVTSVEIYRQLIPNVPNVSEIICVQDIAVERLRTGWGHNGIGWVSDTMPSKIEGCTNVILYYGSSTYDTKQMSRLIDLVIAECKEQGIETLTPAELARLEGYGD